MLCTKCENLPTPTNVAGSCRKCSDKTQYFAYKLCADCSEECDQCERCEAPLTASSSPVPGSGPSAYGITLKDQHNGTTHTGMHANEEVIVILEEDQYSQTEWGPKNTYRYGNTIFRLKANNGFTPYPGQYQKGTRELVFEITGTGTEDLVLEEKTRTYSYYGSSSSPSTTPAANGRTWKATITST